MRNIQISTPEVAERNYPSFAITDTGEVFLIHRNHSGKDAVTWATSLAIDGERVRFDPEVHVLLAIGATVTLTV